MGNHIKFDATGTTIVQVDDAFKSHLVTFEMKEKFSIVFDVSAATFYDSSYPDGTVPSGPNHKIFVAEQFQTKNKQKENLWQIKIKFNDGNHPGGYKYVVKVTGKPDLDPRICPK